MDREILFQGKRLDNGEWVQGSLISFIDGGKVILHSKSSVFQPEGSTFFCSDECYQVDPDTVGQYTGLTDKNGVRIFEGDFCVVRGSGTLAYGFITFYQGCFVFEEEKTKNLLRLCDAEINGYLIEVRGNIHDNPELLKGGAV